jgi:excisionase family DNA binding protein
MEKLLLTPEEAAKVLSIGRSKIYELMSCGQLASVRIGGSRRIPVDALNQFIEGLTDQEALNRSA